jgi:DNA polymerase I
MTEEKLLVCDGHNIAYRSYFAIRNLSRSDGFPTNAIFGFIRQIDSLLARFDPDYMVVVFDGGIPDRRRALLESYKAQRPHMPGDLAQQMDEIANYLLAARVAQLRIEGEEADDVMASIAAAAERRGLADVMLATGDKDMLQLVDERTRVCVPSAAQEPLGPAEVAAKTGVLPEQVVDWLALVGDSADNIPGVAGVGPKTAAALLGEFGSIESIYADLDRIARPSLRAKLLAGRNVLQRNIELVTLDRNVDFGLSLDELSVRPPDTGELLKFYDNMEFNKMAADLREPKLF